MQTCVALPQTHEETAPEFHHHPASTLPQLQLDGSDIPRHHMVLLDPGKTHRLRAKTPLKAMLLGSEPPDGPRHLWFIVLPDR